MVKDKCGNLSACKSVSLTYLPRPDLIINEVHILHHLTGNPNIIELKNVIEDHDNVHIIMELGKGGTLSNRRLLFQPPNMKKSAFKKAFKNSYKAYTEREAKEIFRQIATAIRDYHELGVMHRDIKPDNFVFLSKKMGSVIKMIDFNQATFFKPGERFEQISGSPPYAAPEVLSLGETYGPKADVWSAGVILYTLLSGVLPFWGATSENLLEAIRKSNYKDYSDGPWRKISNSAKDLLRRMLNENQEERISSSGILNHQWLREVGPSAPREITLVRRMQEFKEISRFRRIVMQVIAMNLPKEETEGLKRIFKSFKDAETNLEIPLEEGLTCNEMKNGLQKLGVSLCDSEIDLLISMVDQNGNFVIDETEFIAATMHRNRMERHHRVLEAYQYFDKDNDGLIKTDEIRQVLEQLMFADLRIDKIIEEVYSGETEMGILYIDFEAMVRKGTPVKLARN